MKKIMLAISLIVPAFVMANVPPHPESDSRIDFLLYGSLLPNGDSLDNLTLDGISLSDSFKLCKKNAMTSGQMDSCISDEADSVRNNIETMIQNLDNSPLIKDEEQRKSIIKAINTSIVRTEYLCDVFLVDENKRMEPEKNSAYTSSEICRLARLTALSKELAAM